MSNIKCDVVIPIYNQIEWVRKCVKALFCNTDMNYVNKVYLIDDASSLETKEGCEKIAVQYGERIELIRNKKNQGFVKNCNMAFDLSKADYVLLLNSDCLLSHNAIPKMLKAMEKNKKIGLLTPVSNKASNFSYQIREGYDYQKINKLFEQNFAGKVFDACTIVGFCLMISRSCLNDVGHFDEIFGTGYSEETDYQFKAMAKGYEAKVLIDTYVFHECRVSFGNSDEQTKIRDKNLSIFFSRWGGLYYKLHEEYLKNDPLQYISKNLKYKKDDYKDEIVYTINNNNLEKQIEFLNDSIIMGRSIRVICKNNNYEKYNTFFTPLLKKSFFNKN